jgi:hypothetical protein
MRRDGLSRMRMISSTCVEHWGEQGYRFNERAFDAFSSYDIFLAVPNASDSYNGNTSTFF